MNQPVIKDIGHLAFRARDLELSLAFYAKRAWVAEAGCLLGETLFDARLRA